MMNSEDYEFFSDTESIDDDQQQICTTSNELAAEDVKPIIQLQNSEMASENKNSNLELFPDKTKGKKKSGNPYKCNKCKFSTKVESQFLQHEINHSKEYPFRCTMCEKSFRFKSNCKRHISLHTGERNHTCPVCKKSFTTKANCQRHMKKHKEAAGLGNEHCQSAVHSYLKEEKDGIKEEHAATPKVIKTKKIDKKHMIDTAVIKKENRMEINNESRILNSKRTLDGCNSDNKVQRKRQKLYLDKENKMLTDCLYLEKDAKTNPTETVSEEDNTDKGSLKNVESIDNENDIDLPALAIPRKRFLKNPRKCLIQSENDLLPCYEKNSENKNKQCSDSFGSCSAISDMPISEGPLSLENGIDIPHQDDFEYRNKKVSTSKSNTFEIVVDTDGKCNKNKSVAKHCEIKPAAKIDGIQLDKSPGMSSYFCGKDTQDEAGKYNANEFSITNDCILTPSLQHSNDSNDSAKQKAEQKQTPEFSSIAVDNFNMKKLSEYYPVLSNFDKPERKDTKMSSPTQTDGIDSLIKNKFQAKAIKRNTDKGKQQKVGIGKENDEATSNKNDVRRSSLQGSLLKKMEQPVRMQFWDHNNFIRKILMWTPAWFDEYDKCKTTPPAISKDVNLLLSAYESHEDYFTTVLSHLLLETWELCIQKWQNLKGKRTVIECVFCNRNYTNSNEFSYAYFTVKDHSFKKDDVLLLRSSTDDGKCKAAMCYIEDIIYQRSSSIEGIPGHCLADNKWPISESCYTVAYKVQIKSSHFRMCSNTSESTMEFVHSLKDVISLYDGLATSFTTQLIRHVLKPGKNDIFRSISVEHELNMLVNKNDFNATKSTAIIKAVDMVLEKKSFSRIFLIREPSGTRKTEILIAIIKEIFKRSGGKCCIALSAPTHVAIESLMKRLIMERQKMELKKSGLVLIGVDENYHPDVWKYSHTTHVRNEREMHKRTTATSSVLVEIKRLNEMISSMEERDHSTESNEKVANKIDALIKTRNDLTSQISEERLEKDVLLRGNVICGTFSSFGERQLYLNVLPSEKNNRRKSIFTCMIMDEAEQATELETLSILQYGPSNLIMAGDPEQLTSTVKSQISRDKGFCQSMYTRFCKQLPRCQEEENSMKTKNG